MNEDRLIIKTDDSAPRCWKGDDTLRNDVLLAIPSRAKDLDWVAGTGLPKEANTFQVLLGLITYELTSTKPGPDGLGHYAMSTLGLPMWLLPAFTFGRDSDDVETLVDAAMEILEKFTPHDVVDTYDDRVGCWAFRQIAKYLSSYAEDLKHWSKIAVSGIDRDGAPWGLPVLLNKYPNEPGFTGTFLNGLVGLGSQPPREIEKRDLPLYVNLAATYAYQRTMGDSPRPSAPGFLLAHLLETLTHG